MASKYPEQMTPRAVSSLIRTVWGKSLGASVPDDRDIRGLARGDRGPAVVARYAERPQGGGNRQHSYTHGEVRLLLEAVAARYQRRTGQTLRIPAPFASARPERAQRPKATRKSRKPSPTTTTTASAPESAPESAGEV